MSEKLGTENLDRGLLLGADLANAIDGVTKDGFQPIDLFALLGPAAQLQPVLKSGPAMKAELDDYSLEERAASRAKLMDRLKVGGASEAQIDKVAADIIDALAGIYTMVGSIQDLRSVASKK